MNLTQVRKLIFNKENLTAITKTSGWGKRTYTYNGKKITDFHYGIDYGTKNKNYGLYAITDGVVYKTGKDSTSGNWIYIKYPSLGYMSFYCHLTKTPLVKKGAKVKPDTLVGYAGTTGNSTGIHLHLGFKKIGSDKWINPGDVNVNETRETTEKLNLRANKGTKAKILTTIPKGKKIALIERFSGNSNGYQWAKIKYGNTVGYVADKYIK